MVKGEEEEKEEDQALMQVMEEFKPLYKRQKF